MLDRAVLVSPRRNVDRQRALCVQGRCIDEEALSHHACRIARPGYVLEHVADLFHLILADLDRQGSEVLLESRNYGGPGKETASLQCSPLSVKHLPWDRDHVFALRKNPGERELPDRNALLLCE